MFKGFCAIDLQRLLQPLRPPLTHLCFMSSMGARSHSHTVGGPAADELPPQVMEDDECRLPKGNELAQLSFGKTMLSISTRATPSLARKPDSSLRMSLQLSEAAVVLVPATELSLWCDDLAEVVTNYSVDCLTLTQPAEYFFRCVKNKMRAKGWVIRKTCYGQQWCRL